MCNSTDALSALRPRDPNYITPPAQVDESAPIVDLGGLTAKPRQYGTEWYEGPKLTAKERRPHPESYGAKEWPSLDAWPRKGKIGELLSPDSPALFAGICESLLCKACKGTGLRPIYETPKWSSRAQYVTSKTCGTCSGSGLRVEDSTLKPAAVSDDVEHESTTDYPVEEGMPS